MFNAIGLATVLACVFGSFLISGGRIQVIGRALPHEMLAIAGAAAGAFMLSNSSATVKRAWRGVRMVFRGPAWHRTDYRDLLSLLFALLALLRKGATTVIENHIDAPDKSDLFAPYPRILADRELVDFICDYLRMMTLSFDDPHQLADAMEEDAERHHVEQLLPARALEAMADGLPALGIVAAVLGVIKTMSSIDQPTEILGAMIGGALVGTFLGVLLAYGLVGPIASLLQQTVEADHKPYTLVKTAVVAYAQHMPIQVAVELARRVTPSAYAPSFSELEQALDRTREALAASPPQAQTA